MKEKYFVLALIILIIGNITSIAREKVIYGDDDRVDFFNETDPLKRNLSSSTAALVHKNFLIKIDGGYRVRSFEQFGKKNNLCSDERFYKQQVLAVCSGFLLKDNLIATAGHCYPPSIEDSTCNNYVWVFDYKYFDKQQNEFSFFRDDQVYGCKSVKKSVYTDKVDFAIIETTRIVRDREPVELSRSSSFTGQRIFAIGHPYGLPQKFVSNASIFNVQKEYFSTNLDTFKGNSGSPVFDEKSGEVLGILVRGKADFYQTNEGCMKVNSCHNNRNSCLSNASNIDGEHVNKIERLVSFIDALIY